MFRFADPAWLLLLPAVLAAAWWVARRRRTADARMALPQAALRLRVGGSPWVVLERNLPWMRALVMGLLVVALARPQSGSRIETVSTHGVDIVVALDVSRSMSAEDFRPNRLEAARETVLRFIDGRPTDRLGLVIFATLSASRCPLTLDHELLRQLVREVDFAPRDQSGTAIGMGLATAVNRLRGSEARSKVVVLVTDGSNNAGQIGPAAAAEAARALGVKVYAIGIGSDYDARVAVDGPFGPQYVTVPFDLDEELLQEIAGATDGRYFRAPDEATLGEIFETIDRLEKTEIESRERVLYRELFPNALLPAVLLFLLERLLAATRLRRIP